MAKVSRPIIYTALGAVVVAAILFLTEPDAVTTKKRVKVTKTADAVTDGILPEDLKAHYPRYAGKPRDVFAPVVAPPKPASANTAKNNPFTQGKQGSWTLTGINTVDGVTTALVENSTGDDSVFLKPGDTWHGLRVTRISDTAVVFQNALGQETKLAFVTTEDEAVSRSKTAGGAQPNTTASSPYALPQPGGQLAPMPIQPLPPLRSRRSFERSSN